MYIQPGYFRVLVCLSFILVTARAAGAQQAPPKPDDHGPTQSVAQTGSSYVIERKQLRVRLERDGTGERELTMRVRVNDALAVREWGQLPLTYAPLSEDLEIRQFEVRKADGETVVVGSEAVQDLVVNQQGPSSFVDLRQKHVTVPALQPGDTLAFVVVWIIARPLAPDHAWLEYSFTRNAVVEDERLEVDAPATLAPIVRTTASAPPEAQGGSGEVTGNRRLYRWRTSNSDVQRQDEGDEADATEMPAADVRVTTFAGWDVFARWLGPLMRPSLDATVRARAADITKGLPDQQAKIEALYTYVATEIRYVSLSFGIGRFAPHSPAEVLKNHYGDCKDKHVLLAALLEAIGVKAIPVLVNTSRSISEDVPSPAEFDHVVTAIPSDADPAGWTWLDTTMEVAPFGMLHAATRDRLAFSLGGDGVPHGVVRTPEDPPFDSTESIEVEGEVNALGVLDAHVRFALRGDAELAIRAVTRMLPGEALKEFGEEFARKIGFKGTVSAFTLGDPLATREPFEMTFRLRRGGYLDWAAASSTLDLRLAPFDISTLEQPLKKDRKVGTPTASRRSVTVQLPAGYRATGPADVSIAAGEFRYDSTYTVKENRIRVTRQLSGAPRILLAGQASDYTRMARAIGADVARTVAVTRDTTTPPEIPDGMSAGELYHAGYSAFMANDIEFALTIWTRNTEVDPEMANAWSGVGLALQRLRRYGEAVAAFEKQIELEPSSNRAFRDLGDALKEAGNPERAADAYAKHLELNPADGAVHRALGTVSRESGQHERALAAFEKAAPLLRDDAWIHIEIGETHLDLKQPAKAVEAFDRAIEVSRTPAVLTKIAWEFAENGVEEARAAKLIDEAVRGIEAAVSPLEPAAVRDEHLDLMERLAWCWDARGLIAMRNGNLDGAVRYFDAAWRLGGHAVMAEHLGEAYEKMPNRSADALSAYIIAHALSREPSPSLLARLKRLAGGADLDGLRTAAEGEFMKQRGVGISKVVPDGEAEFTAILNSAGRGVAGRMISGAEAMRSIEQKFPELEFPVTAPDSHTTRMVVKLLVACKAAAKQCGVVITPAHASRVSR